jgi:hypothetical protein
MIYLACPLTRRVAKGCCHDSPLDAQFHAQVVVLLFTTSPKNGKWMSQADAVIAANYPQNGGAAALADTLLGAISPGGRLPTTWPQSWDCDVAPDPKVSEERAALVLLHCGTSAIGRPPHYQPALLATYLFNRGYAAAAVGDSRAAVLRNGAYPHLSVICTYPAPWQASCQVPGAACALAGHERDLPIWDARRDKHSLQLRLR